MRLQTYYAGDKVEEKSLQDLICSLVKNYIHNFLTDPV